MIRGRFAKGLILSLAFLVGVLQAQDLPPLGLEFPSGVGLDQGEFEEAAPEVDVDAILERAERFVNGNEGPSTSETSVRRRTVSNRKHLRKKVRPASRGAQVIDFSSADEANQLFPGAKAELAAAASAPVHLVVPASRAYSANYFHRKPRAHVPHPLRVVWVFPHSQRCSWREADALNAVVELSTSDYGLDIAIMHSSFWCAQTPQADIDVLEALNRKSISHWTAVDVLVTHSYPFDYPTFPFKFKTPTANLVIRNRPTLVVGRSSWIGNRLPSVWRRFAARVDEIWLPSKFLVPGFLGIKEARHLQVIAPGLNAENFKFVKPISSGAHGIVLRKFNILYREQLVDRKGWRYVVEAAVRAFRDDPTVSVTFVTSMCCPKQSRDYVANVILTALKNAGYRGRGFGPDAHANNTFVVNVVTDSLPSEEVVRIHKAMSVYILPSRGEAFGYNVIEAMAVGNPVVATNFSGTNSYLRDDNSYRVAVTRMIEEPGLPGIHFAIPSTSDIAKTLRRIRNHPKEAKRKALLGRLDIIRQFDRKYIASDWQWNLFNAFEMKLKELQT